MYRFADNIESLFCTDESIDIVDVEIEEYDDENEIIKSNNNCHERAERKSETMTIKDDSTPPKGFETKKEENKKYNCQKRAEEKSKTKTVENQSNVIKSLDKIENNTCQERAEGKSETMTTKNDSASMKGVDKEEENNLPNERVEEEVRKRGRSYWKQPEKAMSSSDKRNLISEYLGLICKVIMNHQVYNFGGKTYLQEGYGCIGDEAIGVIAWVIMIWWTKKLKRKLKELKITYELMKLYVDDLNGIYGSVEPGTEYKNGELVFNVEKAETDKQLPEDQVTMEVIKSIANEFQC